MTTTTFSEPARLNTPLSTHCFNKNRWSATWFWSLLSKVFHFLTSRLPVVQNLDFTLIGRKTIQPSEPLSDWLQNCKKIG